MGTEFQVGDAVAVKPGVQDADMGGDIGGWQGRVLGLHPDEDPPTADITWDSVTLKNMTPMMIEHCEEEGLDWSEMCLYADELISATPRDTIRDVEKAKQDIGAQYAWVGVAGGEQGRRIQKVVNSAQGRGELAVFQAWHHVLVEGLSFPFDAILSDGEGRSVRLGDQVTVLDIADLDEMYGTLVDVKHKRSRYVLPLCDLKAVQKDSATHDLVYDYAVWFANR